MSTALASRGVLASLGAALLFGAGTPLAKLLLENTSPWLLAALLYLGSGLGLAALRLLRGSPPAQLARGELKWLAAAIVSGGIAGPLLLMWGLSSMPASGASLLLNAEAVLTAVIAWVVFKENVDRRIALGMLAIVAGGLVVSWPGSVGWTGWKGPALVVGACLCWGLDNNFTRKVSLTDASWIAMVKGLTAGSTNLALALAVGVSLPPAASLLAAGAVGFASYGASLALFVVGLRELGTARTGAYFSVAPFFGALIAVLLLGEPLTGALVAAGVLMATGVLLHLTERHEHHHVHEPMDHAHTHVHGAGDEHHEHVHVPAVPAGTRHSHPHHHEALAHGHAHYPDAHHRHVH